MIYAEYIDENGNSAMGIWHLTLAKWMRLAKDEGLKFTSLIDFTLIGKEYRSLKEQVRSIAIEWSYAEKPDISYRELFAVQNWFERMGKRYHLLEEFRENAIC